MKRTILLGLAVLAGTALIGLSVAWSKPSWLPAWARVGPIAGAGAATADAGLYCKEHGVPEKFCTICHPELNDKLLLCPEHGNIPEDICTLCHPEVEKKYNIQMCEEHGLPEAFCVECGHGPSAAANLPDDGWCAAHNRPEELCEECRWERAAATANGETPTLPGCKEPLPTVRLASTRLADRIGLKTAPAVEETHAHHLIANAETSFDANRLAEISPRVHGYLRDIRADLGQSVRQGEILAVVDSSEVSAAKSRFNAAKAAAELAEVTHDRTARLAKTGSVAAKDTLETLTALNQARASLMDAEQKLRNLGFGDYELERTAQTHDTSSLLEIIAPIDGTVVTRHAVQGEAVQPTTQLFSVADTSSMWLWIDVYEGDIDKVKLGESLMFRISGTDGPDFPGTITWIGVEVNPTTRTTRVRAELANPNGKLRANLFGQAEIQIGKEHKTVVVPREAVQHKDDTMLVFLPDKAGTYRPQRVLTRPSDRRDVVEVTWGLKPGQKVVTQGAFLLKTEIMKGSIGAGCCE